LDVSGSLPEAGKGIGPGTAGMRSALTAVLARPVTVFEETDATDPRPEIDRPCLHLNRDVVGVYLVRPPPTNDLLEGRPKVFQQASIDVIDVAIRLRPPRKRGDSLKQSLEICFIKQKVLLAPDA
jgi:hypothetical protein